MNEILAQAKWPNGIITPWANQPVGTSNKLIHAIGCFLTEIAEIIGLTPDLVNARLTEVGGYAADKDGQLDLVIWEKIKDAFPGWVATYNSPYNNDEVLAALNAGHSVIVQVDAGPIGNPGGLHAVRYMGGGVCHDPYTGVERPTSDFPDVKAFNVFSKAQPVVNSASSPVEPGVNPASETTYKGLDLKNVDSVKAAIDAWYDVANGLYVKTDEMAAFTTGVAHALGVDPTTPHEKIIADISALRNPPNTVTPAITLANLPAHEKTAVLTQVENAALELKKLLGL